jgi:hypothetical protein
VAAPAARARVPVARERSEYPRERSGTGHPAAPADSGGRRARPIAFAMAWSVHAGASGHSGGRQSLADRLGHCLVGVWLYGLAGRCAQPVAKLGVIEQLIDC